MIIIISMQLLKMQKVLWKFQFVIRKMIQEYVLFWKKTFDLKGKSSRREYWFVVLANFLIYLFLIFLSKFSMAFYNLFIFYFYLQVIPNLSIQIRRARDAGKKWFVILINLLPFIGSIYWIYILILPSNE